MRRRGSKMVAKKLPLRNFGNSMSLALVEMIFGAVRVALCGPGLGALTQTGADLGGGLGFYQLLVPRRAASRTRVTALVRLLALLKGWQ
jgi:hypothetical protein